MEKKPQKKKSKEKNTLLKKPLFELKKTLFEMQTHHSKKKQHLEKHKTFGKKLIENIGEIKNFEKTVQEKTKPFGKRKQYPISFLFLKKKLFFKKNKPL